jgi:hypothetical protein
MTNLLQRIQSTVILKSQRLVSLLLFRKRGAIRTHFGSFLSPKESEVASDLTLHEKLRPLIDRFFSEKIDLPLTRLGSERDGGYVVVDKDYKDSFLISGGILNDNNFELALAELGARVHQVDYSIIKPPVAHPSLTFSAERLVGENKKKLDFDVTLDELVAKATSAKNSELLLKLDIEGSEWEIFETSNSLHKFSQIFLELHYLDRLADSKYTESSIDALEKLLNIFFPVFISGNNCCGFVTLGGYVLPRVMELTLLNRDFYSPLPSDHTSINQKYQSQNYPNKAPLVLKGW